MPRRSDGRAGGVVDDVAPAAVTLAAHHLDTPAGQLLRRAVGLRQSQRPVIGGQRDVAIEKVAAIMDVDLRLRGEGGGEIGADPGDAGQSLSLRIDIGDVGDIEVDDAG